MAKLAALHRGRTLSSSSRRVTSRLSMTLWRGKRRGDGGSAPVSLASGEGPVPREHAEGRGVISSLASARHFPMNERHFTPPPGTLLTHPGASSEGHALLGTPSHDRHDAVHPARPLSGPGHPGEEGGPASAGGIPGRDLRPHLARGPSPVRRGGEARREPPRPGGDPPRPHFGLGGDEDGGGGLPADDAGRRRRRALVQAPRCRGAPEVHPALRVERHLPGCGGGNSLLHGGGPPLPEREPPHGRLPVP